MALILNNIVPKILFLPRIAKRFIVLALDVGLCVFATWIAFYLRLGEFVDLSGKARWAVLVSVCVALPIFIKSGFYRAIFRHSGLPVLLSIARATVFYGAIFCLVFTVFGVQGVPRTIGIIQPILLLMMVAISRAVAWLWLGGHYQRHLRRMMLPSVLIYGAGAAGRQVLAALAHNHEMRVVGFIDDDASLHGLLVNDKPVYAPKDIDALFGALKISSVLLALPSVSLSRRNEIVTALLKHKVSVQTVPSLTELAQGKIDISAIRRVDIEDLLGREPVAPDPILISRNVSGRVVLVTGAGGSIGSELCRQILARGPERLLLLDQSEPALYAIHEELEREFAEGGCPLIPLLGSVCDEGRVREIFSTFRPDSVYHAAAYKHVPLVEHNVFEGIRNNVFGTMTVAKLAAEYGASDFVLISTDKAVRPTNVMGATKRLAEMVLQSLALEGSATRFAMVRFGNVLGSSGSVVPKFRQQIAAGGPITVTHADVTRYFMSIPEAAQLVIQAGAMAGGGDVFLLDMGRSIKLMDLARRMFVLSGLPVRDGENPLGDIAIEVTGLRPGEKLYEELLIGDASAPTAHPMIMKSLEVTLPRGELEMVLVALERAMLASDARGARSVLLEGVSGYQPTGAIVDWVHREREDVRKEAAAIG